MFNICSWCRVVGLLSREINFYQYHRHLTSPFTLLQLAAPSRHREHQHPLGFVGKPRWHAMRWGWNGWDGSGERGRDIEQLMSGCMRRQSVSCWHSISKLLSIACRFRVYKLHGFEGFLRHAGVTGFQHAGFRHWCVWDTLVWYFTPIVDCAHASGGPHTTKPAIESEDRRPGGSWQTSDHRVI